MPIEFKRHNEKFQTDNPSEPSHVDTGTDDATAIERYNNTEGGTQEVFRRPVEQIRRRSRHSQEEFNVLEKLSQAKDGRFLDPGTSTVKWNGLGAAGALAGTFELSGPLHIAHPAYPDTVIEVPSSVIGNSTTGWFQQEENRLLEEGDSLWITFGSDSQTSAARDISLRPEAGTLAATVTQPQLRKGPTWIMVSDSVLDLTAQSIVVGSDKLRIFQDPVSNPTIYLERTIKAIYKDPAGVTYLEVAHDSPIFDKTTIPSKVLPPPGNSKLTRAATGAQYAVVDSGGTTTRVPQRALSAFWSNLIWFQPAQVVPMTPESGANAYRENEWLHAIPLASVQNGNLHFPLASSAGVPPSTTTQHSLLGYVRTSIADEVPAAHNFSGNPSFKNTAGAPLATFSTDSTGSNGAGKSLVNVKEAATAGITPGGGLPGFWTAPNRPNKIGLKGQADALANNFVEFVEQGYYEDTGNFYEESALRLKLPGAVGVPTTHGGGFGHLKASQMRFIQSVSTNKIGNLSTKFPLSDEWLRKITGDNTGTPISIPSQSSWDNQGILVGNIVLGLTEEYMGRVGTYLVRLKGVMGLHNIYRPYVAASTGNIAAGGRTHPQASHQQELGFDFTVPFYPSNYGAASPLRTDLTITGGGKDWSHVMGGLSHARYEEYDFTSSSDNCFNIENYRVDARSDFYDLDVINVGDLSATSTGIDGRFAGVTNARPTDSKLLHFYTDTDGVRLASLFYVTDRMNNATGVLSRTDMWAGMRVDLWCQPIIQDISGQDYHVLKIYSKMTHVEAIGTWNDVSRPNQSDSLLESPYVQEYVAAGPNRVLPLLQGSMEYKVEELWDRHPNYTP